MGGAAGEMDAEVTGETIAGYCLLAMGHPVHGRGYALAANLDDYGHPGPAPLTVDLLNRLSILGLKRLYVSVSPPTPAPHPEGEIGPHWADKGYSPHREKPVYLVPVDGQRALGLGLWVFARLRGRLRVGFRGNPVIPEPVRDASDLRTYGHHPASGNGRKPVNGHRGPLRRDRAYAHHGLPYLGSTRGCLDGITAYDGQKNGQQDSDERLQGTPHWLAPFAKIAIGG